MTACTLYNEQNTKTHYYGGLIQKSNTVIRLQITANVYKDDI